jgi:hypothetical protein
MYIHVRRFLCWKYHNCKLRDVNASSEFFGIATLATLHHRNDFSSVLNNRNLVNLFFLCITQFAQLIWYTVKQKRAREREREREGKEERKTEKGNVEC